MDPKMIGIFIAKKRKEKNLTQAQLAERLGVSNKTISKWETGRCMPDYSVIGSLCRELDVSMAELMEGEEAADGKACVYDDAQMLDLIKRIQNLEHQRTSLYGLVLIIMGMALLVIHYNIGGGSVEDFISGFLAGIAIVEMLVGVYVTIRGISQQK